MQELIGEFRADREERKREMKEFRELLAEKQSAWNLDKEEAIAAQKRIVERLDRLENAERRRNLILSNNETRETNFKKIANEIGEFIKEKTKEKVNLESVS